MGFFDAYRLKLASQIHFSCKRICHLRNVIYRIISYINGEMSQILLLINPVQMSWFWQCQCWWRLWPFPSPLSSSLTIDARHKLQNMSIDISGPLPTSVINSRNQRMFRCHHPQMITNIISSLIRSSWLI